MPQIALEVDREKARTWACRCPMCIPRCKLLLGGAYVNDFNRFGRLYRVFVQAGADFRQKPEDIGQFCAAAPPAP
ncbi:MAG: efflux RND transporter permease subunit [Kiritimatiellia bacterium]